MVPLVQVHCTCKQLFDSQVANFVLDFFGYNLVFLLSGGGKFNYQGTKRWIEDNLESTGEHIIQA